MQQITGIIAATELEIGPFIKNGLPDGVKTCITGIGTGAAAFAISNFINEHKPGLLLQAGIAGCFDKKIPLSSFHIVTKDCFADLGVMESNTWRDMFDLGLAERDIHPYQDGWLVNNNDWPVLNNYSAVTGITVNEITTSVIKNETWINKYNPVLETLEGAALHYVCLMKNIPFIQFRTVSNYVGERDKNNWEIEKAIIHLNKKLAALLPALMQ